MNSPTSQMDEYGQCSLSFQSREGGAVCGRGRKAGHPAIAWACLSTADLGVALLQPIRALTETNTVALI